MRAFSLSTLTCPLLVAVLGDRVSHYHKSYFSTHVTNPGCFASDFSFTLYTPVDREVQVCYIDEVDDIPGSTFVPFSFIYARSHISTVSKWTC